MESKNARLGLKLFFVYLFLYGGFVLINTFSAETMELTPVAGVNLAILSGFGLIVAAMALALIYGFLCEAETPVASNDAAAAPTETPQSVDSSATSAEGDSQ